MRRERGFLLVEATVGLAVASGALLLILAVIWHQARAIRDAQQTQVAANLAEARIERLRATPYAEMRDTTRATLDLAKSPAAGRLRNPRAFLTIREYDPMRPGLKHVIVTIRWGATIRREAKYRIETLITDRDGGEP